MPDHSHVIDVVRHLTAAHIAYQRMAASGFDRSLAANKEILTSEMTIDGKLAASVWLDFLDALRETVGVVG